MNDVLTFFENPMAQTWSKFFIGLVLILLGIRLLNRMLGKYVSDNATPYSARKFVGFLGFLILLFFATVVFNYKLSSLTLALGVTGAGIAFALQEIIVSVAGFLAVLFNNFYKAGDRIQLGGIKGDVVDIGVLRTTLMETGDWVKGDLYNGKMVRVANSFVFKEPVYNYSGDFPFLWDEISIPLRHGSDYHLAKQKFLEILNEELGEYTTNCEQSWNKLTQELYVEKAQIHPMATLTFDENWLSITLRYVVDFKKRRGTKDVLFSKILDVIHQTPELEIAAATLEVTQPKS
ncbi:mechanosensitive ion channel family protein [Reichenbachiella sp.]